MNDQNGFEKKGLSVKDLETLEHYHTRHYYGAALFCYRNALVDGAWKYRNGHYCRYHCRTRRIYQ